MRTEISMCPFPVFVLFLLWTDSGVAHLDEWQSLLWYCPDNNFFHCPDRKSEKATERRRSWFWLTVWDVVQGARRSHGYWDLRQGSRPYRIHSQEAWGGGMRGGRWWIYPVSPCPQIINLLIVFHYFSFLLLMMWGPQLIEWWRSIQGGCLLLC